MQLQNLLFGPVLYKQGRTIAFCIYNNKKLINAKLRHFLSYSHGKYVAFDMENEQHCSGGRGAGGGNAVLIVFMENSKYFVSDCLREGRKKKVMRNVFIVCCIGDNYTIRIPLIVPSF